MQISAIFSDYDGTLSPTTYLNSDNKTGRLTKHRNQIQLDRVLREISNKRIIGISMLCKFKMKQSLKTTLYNNLFTFTAYEI